MPRKIQKPTTKSTKSTKASKPLRALRALCGSHLLRGDCRKVLPELRANSVDACVCDPPYELGFMGKRWDGTGVAFQVETWAEVLRVLKPGAHLLAFGGARTYHRMACAIEDAGFEVRDCVMWIYGSGFPKSLDLSKTLDKRAGAKREMRGLRISPDGRCRASEPSADKPFGTRVVYGEEKRSNRERATETSPATDDARRWNGWGTALKPAYEPIIMARKPLDGTVANNVLEHGTGALNIDGCRVCLKGGSPSAARREQAALSGNCGGDLCSAMRARDGGLPAYRKDVTRYVESRPGESLGRWPANVIHDGSEEVVALFPPNASPGNGPCQIRRRQKETGIVFGAGLVFCRPAGPGGLDHGDSGSAARFFYCAKTSRRERGDGNTHPTVKPQALMRYLVRLVTPPGGLVLDPFLGSGSTALAAIAEGFRVLGIEQDVGYLRIARRRLKERKRR